MKRAIAVLMILSCAAFGQQKAPRATTATYQISGVVVSATTGEALAGASVMLSPALSSRARLPLRPGRRNGPDDERVVRSAADGTFAFGGIAPGKYSLSAVRHGYPQQSFEEHDQFASAIVVGPDKVSTGIRFRMEPDASISGTVLDEHNEPVMNAMVMLFRDGIQNGRHGVFRAQEVMSNDLGRYHFAHLKAGKYYVAVSGTPWYAENGRVAYGGGAGGGRVMSSVTTYVGPGPGTGNAALDVAYPFTFYPGVTDSSQAEPISIVPGQRESADFTLAAVPSLHVRVRVPVDNPERNVIAMMTREVFGSTDVGGSVRNMNYGQGVTEIAGVTPGRYILQLRGIGPERGQQLLTQREIEITGDTEINSVDAPSGVNLSGTIRFDGPAPTGAVRLMLRKLGMPTPPLQVNDKGEISASEPIAPGKYDVFLPMPNYQITQISVKGAALDGQTIDVGSDDVHFAIEAAKASANIEGTALKGDKAVAGAMIVLVPQDMSRPMLYRRDQSDSDGSFELTSIPPGTYTLVAIENGWDLEWSNPEVMKPFLASGEKVQVAIDGHYHVDAKVQSIPGAQ
ncbi:MAG: carboxypeptidase regulatory-like domain-containing protein [Terriglobales bacterium]